MGTGQKLADMFAIPLSQLATTFSRTTKLFSRLMLRFRLSIRACSANAGNVISVTRISTDRTTRYLVRSIPRFQVCPLSRSPTITPLTAASREIRKKPITANSRTGNMRWGNDRGRLGMDEVSPVIESRRRIERARRPVTAMNWESRTPKTAYRKSVRA